MASQAPIVITLYDEENEGTEFSRVFVPWGVLKRAVRFMGFNEAEMTDEDVDAMAGIVCEAFGNKFSVADLDQGADVGEMMAVIQNIITRANFQKGGRQIGAKERGSDGAKGERPLPEMLREA